MTRLDSQNELRFIVQKAGIYTQAKRSSYRVTVVGRAVFGHHGVYCTAVARGSIQLPRSIQYGSRQGSMRSPQAFGLSHCLSIKLKKVL